MQTKITVNKNTLIAAPAGEIDKKSFSDFLMSFFKITLQNDIEGKQKSKRVQKLIHLMGDIMLTDRDVNQNLESVFDCVYNVFENFLEKKDILNNIFFKEVLQFFMPKNMFEIGLKPDTLAIILKKYEKNRFLQLREEIASNILDALEYSIPHRKLNGSEVVRSFICIFDVIKTMKGELEEKKSVIILKKIYDKFLIRELDLILDKQSFVRPLS